MGQTPFYGIIRTQIPSPATHRRTVYSGLTKTSTALPRLSSKRTIL
ncbi:branched-chain amino acid permease [Neisseria meningitidis]|nr:branched-chain amino acid permease [Neisseria meningitidis]